MNGTFTAADLTTILGAVTAVLILWWRVETRISAGAVKAQAKADAVERDLAEFKLAVAQSYAPNGWVKDVENRMVSRLEQIVDELHGLRQDFKDVMMGAVSGPGKRRGVK
jgi:hypothetical protein